MQVFTKLLALTLFCGLILQSGIEPAAAQTTSQTQKQHWNERPPAYRLPGIPFDGSMPLLSASRAEIVKQRGTAAKDSNNTLIGRWIGGPCQAAVVEGTRAFFNNGPYRMIADISDPRNPIELGRVLVPYVSDIAVIGNLAYVAAGEGGLRIIEVNDPVKPNEVGFFETGSFATDVAISGNYAYVTTQDNGLRLIDISNPSSPTEVGFLSTGFLGGSNDKRKLCLCNRR